MEYGQNLPPRNIGLGLGNKTKNQVGCLYRTFEANRFHLFQILAPPIGPGADQEAEKDGLSIFWSLVYLSSVPGDTVELPMQTKKGTEYPSSKY